MAGALYGETAQKTTLDQPPDENGDRTTDTSCRLRQPFDKLSCLFHCPDDHRNDECPSVTPIDEHSERQVNRSAEENDRKVTNQKRTDCGSEDEEYSGKFS